MSIAGLEHVVAPVTACPVAPFPAARPGDDVRAVLPRRDLAPLDPHDSATALVLSRGLSRLGARDRQRVVDGWRVWDGGHEAPLVTDEGCDVRVGHAGVGEDVRVALLHWLPVTRTDLALLEGGLFRDAPADALTLLVRPPTIWSLHEALVADRRVPRRARFQPERFAALERHARARVHPRHLRRLRRAAARIEGQLPLEGLPVANATVAAGCAVIATDDAWCGEIAARQLARYAVSAVVGGAELPL